MPGDIPLSANFDLRSERPLDGRTYVSDLAELNGISYPYDGLQVWVAIERRKYRYDGVLGQFVLDLPSSDILVFPEWSSTTEYSLNQKVEESTRLYKYINVNPSTGNRPSQTEGVYWRELSKAPREFGYSYDDIFTADQEVNGLKGDVVKKVINSEIRLFEAVFSGVSGNNYASTDFDAELENFDWIEISPSSGGTYTQNTPTGTTVGGIQAGTTLGTKSHSQLWALALNAYQAPAFSSFSIQFQPVQFEVGDGIPAGVRNFLWATSNNSNINANSLVIRDVTSNTNLLTGQANDGTADYEFLSDVISTNHLATRVFRISGVNTNSGSFQRDLTITWFAKFFKGKSTSTVLDETAAEALNSSLTETPVGTKSFASGAGYIYYVYESSIADISTMKDQATNFDVPFLKLSNITLTNSFSTTKTYKVFRTLNQINGAITLITT